MLENTPDPADATADDAAAVTADDAAAQAAIARRAAADSIPLHELLGLSWDRPNKGDQVATIRMPVRPEAFGFTANLHGGAIATMVDLACALVSAMGTDFDSEAESIVTSDMHIRYLGTPRTAMVYARAEIVRAGKTLIVIGCEVRDENEHLLATADVSMMRVAIRKPVPAAVDPAAVDPATADPAAPTEQPTETPSTRD